MAAFGDFEVRLDPWQVEYGAEIPALTDPTEEDAESVRTDVEVAPSQWQPISPEGAPAPELVLVDGVRRIEARIVVRHGGTYCQGVFGAYAVGAATLRDGAAAFGPLRAGRVVVTGGGTRLDGPVRVGQALCYRPLAADGNDADAPLLKLHGEMRLAEETLARECLGGGGGLVVTDGPLTFEARGGGAVVGYIKRISRLYLPPELLEVLATLPAAHRTPLFALVGTRRFARYSWFLRLADPRPGDSRFSGIVRLEVAESVGRAAAARLAGLCAASLPRLASRRGLHARAPQNLLPIGALESRLKRELGDVQWIHRTLRSFIAREATHA